MGPMEMFTKMSKVDVQDLVTWVKEHNWSVVIGYRATEHNVFDIDKSDPWRHKWVADLGRIPARKPSVSIKDILGGNKNIIV